MEIEEKSSVHEIACYFAPGSQTKGCRIVIIPEGRGGDCELNTTTTATRLEGAGDAVWLNSFIFMVSTGNVLVLRPGMEHVQRAVVHIKL